VSTQPITVLKFGSSVLAGPRDLPAAVHEIYRELRAGCRVVAVVSAFAGATDRLIEAARKVCETPADDALAMLVATGEAQSAALLAIALERSGVPSLALDAARAGLATRGDLLDAEPCALDVPAIRAALERGAVVVVPGFVGRDASGRTSLLGRGGSDLSALFIAQRLRAQTCRLLKDVDGVYDRDPAAGGARARRFESLTFADALAIGGRIVQAKALRFAMDERVAFEVAAPGSNVATRVGADATALVAAHDRPRKLRVGLLGLGTVGLGVYREIARDRERFELAKILVRRRSLASRRGVARELLASGFQAVLDADCDVIVEALGGLEPASSCIDAALRAGVSVITANKAAVALHGARWRELAAQNDQCFSYSAAVGGAVPMLETVRRAAGERNIESLEGILNATTNFVLDLVADGLEFDAAVARAKELGYCEADPRLDLDGTDAAHKLELLAPAAFGDDVRVTWSERIGIEHLRAVDVRAARALGGCVRLVASCERTADGASARVAPQLLDRFHALSSTRGESNSLVVRFAGGESLFLTGLGAGRFPTTESLLGDLLELSRRDAPRVLAQSAAS
jgi:homoserine dehydrogenase